MIKTSSAFLLFLIFSGCIVSKKKFDDMLAQKVKAEAELNEKSDQLNTVSNNYATLEQNFNQLKADTATLSSSIKQNKKDIDKLETDYKQLNTLYTNLLSNSGKINRDFTQQQAQLFTIQQNLERTRKQNDSLNTSLADREKKVAELEQVLANKDKAVQALRTRISNALLNFKENDLTVKIKNGKVYVSLAEQLLFGSGSIEVDKKGVQALQQLAKALKDQKDINIMVEGHTDNVPVSKKSQYMQDNWDLSVMRATTITKILVNGGVSSKQVVPAGKGEFSPLVANDNPENKQKNRRTEIIVTPDLGELFKILESN